MSSLRFVGVSWLLQFKMIMRSPFDGFGNVIYPLFFATVAFFVFRAGSSPRTLVYASLGAAVMGMWSSVSTSAGSAMQRERWWGTLELLVAAPRHFRLRSPPRHARAGHGRDLQPGRDAALGPAAVRDRPDDRAPAAVRALDPRHGALVRRARLPVRGVVRPLPGGLGARQLLRVPGLADLRLPRAAGAAPGLGAPDLLGARADLGHERDPRVGASAGRRSPTCSSASGSVRPTSPSACSSPTASCAPPASAGRSR